MDLLYVTEGIPTRDPAQGDGSSMIAYELVRNLDPGIEISLISFGSDQDVPADVRERCADLHVFALGGRRLSDVKSLVSGRSAGAFQRVSARSRRAIAELSSRADVTLLHGPHICLASAAYVAGPLVAQVVDPWSHRSSMEAKVAQGWRRSYWRRVARKALEAEQNLPTRARLLTVGQRDAERWSSQLGRPVRSIGNGVSVEGERPGLSGDATPTICFAGGLNYGPNIESAQILVREIAPRIWSEMPQTRVVIAGRQPDASVLALQSAQVEVRANVPSMTDVFRASQAAVFPDRHGLGVRNSVTEALAAGTPVFATPTAAREQAEHPLLHVADDSAELARMICAELKDPQERQDIPMRGWDVVAAEYEHELAQARSPAD